MWKTLIDLFKKDNLLVQALKESYTMLEMDFEMYQASVKSLRECDDGRMEIDIFAMDKQINAYERDVRRKVTTHLAVTGRDLTSGLALVSVVIDIERIGDYTKNIYDLARNHPRRLHAGSMEGQLQEIEKRVTESFRDMIQAFKISDEEQARRIMAGYKESLSAACSAVSAGIVSGKAPDLNSQDAAAVALYVWFLKRIAAHSRNIISSVVNPFPRIGYKEKRAE